MTVFNTFSFSFCFFTLLFFGTALLLFDNFCNTRVTSYCKYICKQHKKVATFYLFLLYFTFAAALYFGSNTVLSICNILCYSVFDIEFLIMLLTFVVLLTFFIPWIAMKKKSGEKLYRRGALTRANDVVKCNCLKCIKKLSSSRWYSIIEAISIVFQ